MAGCRNPKEIYIDQMLRQVDANRVPIIVPMGKDKDNKNYNINADTAAGAIAKKINARRLLLMTEIGRAHV